MSEQDPAIEIGEAADDLLPDKSSVTFANDFLDHAATDELGRRVLYSHRGEFHRFTGCAYEVQSEERIYSEVYKHMRSCRVRTNVGSRSRPIWASPKNTPAFQPEPKQVRDVVQTLLHECAADVESMPAWLGDPGANKPSPSSVITFRNGLIDVDQYIRDDGLAILSPPSPEWFCATCLPFEFDANAQCPTWEAFVAEALSNDTQAMRLLQEWTGLLLTAETRWQKLMWLFGPPGSGKGTTIRMIQHLLGPSNFASPTLTELAGPFSLESLLDKVAAFVPDAHLDGRESAGVLDRVLSITGEDRQNVCRKNRSTIAGVKLRARFTIAVNRMPHLPDASNAILRRSLLLPFRNIFIDREDHTLEDRLAEEAAGVINWALIGLLNLRDQVGFTEVDAAKPILASFRRLNAPLEAFVRDECAIAKDEWIPCSQLWEAYKKWRGDNGHKPTSSAAMGADLQALGLPITKRRLGGAGERTWVYAGLNLRARTPHSEEGGDDNEAGRLFA